jgi:hypothetical protein
MVCDLLTINEKGNMVCLELVSRISAAMPETSGDINHTTTTGYSFLHMQIFSPI